MQHLGPPDSAILENRFSSEAVMTNSAPGFLADLSPGDRTAALALACVPPGTHHGETRGLYERLSNLQCWDAMLLCAWMAKGIHSSAIEEARDAKALGILENQDFGRVFGPGAKRVNSAWELVLVPKGAMVGFVHNKTRNLRHAMIHVGRGWGCGNKNDCILRSGHTIGWEKLDMQAFFGADARFNGNDMTSMFVVPVTGQTIS